MPFFLQKIEELDFHIDYFYSIFASPRMRGKRTFCESSSAGRARPCQGRGRGFESRLSLQLYIIFYARVAQLVEHDLAKVGVAGSNPVSRSTFALVVELVDTQDLKSCGPWAVRVQVPPGVLNRIF